jgi:hypothetical protein
LQKDITRKHKNTEAKKKQTNKNASLKTQWKSKRCVSRREKRIMREAWVSCPGGNSGGVRH